MCHDNKYTRINITVTSMLVQLP